MDRRFKIIVKIIAIIAVLAFLVFLFFIVFRRGLVKQQEGVLTNKIIPTTVRSGPTAPFPILSTNDTDKDGLPDAEEGLRGTDPKKADTDNDGMSDGEEVKGLGTNPLNPDTDGDGHKDGDEIKGGYNPLGLGKLK